MKTRQEIINELSDKQNQDLLHHFNEIYECKELNDHENNIIYLAWLWDNGYVYTDNNSASYIDETETGLPFNTFEITFEDEEPGGVNLDLTYSYYELDKIFKIIKDNKIRKATKVDFAKKEELLQLLNDDKLSIDEYHKFLDKYNWEPVVFEEGGKHGLKSAAGDIIIPAMVDEIRLLSSWGRSEFDKVCVEVENKWGIIRADGSGDWLIEPKYEYIGFPNSLTHVRLNGKSGVLDINNNKVILPIENDTIFEDMGFMFINGVGSFEKDGKSGIITEDGKISGAIFDEIEYPILGTVKVRLNNKWGFIDEKGNFTTNEDLASFFSSDVF